MRRKCDICGEHKQVNDDNECPDCIQDRWDLEDWVPEDGYAGDNEENEDE